MTAQRQIGKVVAIGDPDQVTSGVPNTQRIDKHGNASTNQGTGHYETVAASQTAQVLGATGAAGDLIVGVVIIPAAVSPGSVALLDNTTSITLFPGGTDSLTELKPFYVPLGMHSTAGAWKITTGANVSCIAVGSFT